MQSVENDSKIVFLGASNTATKASPNGSFVSKMPDRGTPWTNLEIINEGTGGAGVDSFFLEFERSGENTTLSRRTLDYNSTYLFVMLGGNDWLRGTTVEKFEIEFNWMLDFFQAQKYLMFYISPHRYREDQ